MVCTGRILSVELCLKSPISEAKGIEVVADFKLYLTFHLADKKVFAKYEPLGWYSNSTEKLPLGDVLPGDLELHKQIAQIYENPLYLLLDTSQAPGAREIPVCV